MAFYKTPYDGQEATVGGKRFITSGGKWVGRPEVAVKTRYEHQGSEIYCGSGGSLDPESCRKFRASVYAEADSALRFNVQHSGNWIDYTQNPTSFQAMGLMEVGDRSWRSEDWFNAGTQGPIAPNANGFTPHWSHSDWILKGGRTHSFESVLTGVTSSTTLVKVELKSINPSGNFIWTRMMLTLPYGITDIENYRLSLDAGVISGTYTMEHW